MTRTNEAVRSAERRERQELGRFERRRRRARQLYTQRRATIRAAQAEALATGHALAKEHGTTLYAVERLTAHEHTRECAACRCIRTHLVAYQVFKTKIKDLDRRNEHHDKTSIRRVQ